MDDKAGKIFDEPIILPISAYLRAEPPTDPDPRPEHQMAASDPEIERFWAGRTFAMRRSARRAA